MPQNYPLIQTAFNGGELSPEVFGRVDLEKYASGCATLKNFISLIHGPATRRPGLQFIYETKDSTKLSKLIGFEFSVTQAYILEFCDQLLRVFKDGGIVIGGDMVTNGGMEDDDNWASVDTPTTQEQSVEQRYEGDYSRKFTVDAEDEGIESDTWTSVTGVTYTVVAYVYPDDTTNVNIVIRKGDDSGDLYDQDHTGLTQDAWNLITFEVTETAGGSGAYIQFRSPTGQTSGTWYIDSVSVKKDTDYELATTYTESQLPDLDTAQSADTLYIAHGRHPPSILTRTDHDEWSLSDIEFIDGPYLDENITDITLTPAAATGTGINLTASAALWRSDDVDRLVSIKHTGTPPVWGVARITAVTSATVAVVDILRDFGGTAARTTWKLGVWCERYGYPTVVTFSGDRLIFGSSPSFPQHLWLSKVGFYTDHGAAVNTDGEEIDVADDDALVLVLGAKKINVIRWIEGLRKLTVGTVGAEWWLASNTGEGAITALSKRAWLGSSHGSNETKPVVVGHIALFLQRYGKILRELRYAFEEDTFVGDELTQLAPHLTEEHGITAMAYQHSPFRVVWCVRSDGTLLGCTYSKAQNVVAWHVHETEGEVEDVAVISGDSEDELWVIVKRYVDGSYVRYIERLAPKFTSSDLADAFFVDSGLSLDNRQDIDSITFADPGVINLVGHGYTDGDMVMFRTIDDDVSGEEDYSSLNYEEYEVAHKTADTFQLHDEDGDDVDLSEYKQIISASVAKMETTVSGLDHLEGETVSILADGRHEEDQEVSSGAVTISGNGGSVIHVGLGFTSDLETLNPELSPTQELTLQSLTKRIVGVAFRYYKSLGGFFGPSDSDLHEVMFVSDAVMMGRSADLFSGTTESYAFDGGFGSDVKVFFRQSQPLPTTLLAILYDLEPEEEG